MSNRLQEIIAIIEAEIAAGQRPKLAAGNKRMVDCEKLLDLLGDLKVSIPDEVRIAYAVTAEKDQILENARSQAKAIVANARREAEKLLSRDAIIAQAKSRALNIVERAQDNADSICQGARGYADDILVDLMQYMREYVEIIEHNRQELHSMYFPDQEQPEKGVKPDGDDGPYAGESYDEEYDD